MSVELIAFLSLTFLGYVFGRRAEKKHFKSIIEREDQYSKLLTFSSRYIPASTSLAETDATLVTGNVVISIDYFKNLVAGLRSLVGGQINAYETLVERARREAILRMKEDAMAKGATSVFNVKLETASISKGYEGQVGSVEVYAYGTALIPKAK